MKTDGPTMFKVWNRREPIEQAIRADRIRFEGSTTTTRRLPDVSDVDDQRRAALQRDYATRCQGFAKDGGLAGDLNLTTVTAVR